MPKITVDDIRSAQIRIQKLQNKKSEIKAQRRMIDREAEETERECEKLGVTIDTIDEKKQGQIDKADRLKLKLNTMIEELEEMVADD